MLQSLIPGKPVVAGLAQEDIDHFLENAEVEFLRHQADRRFGQGRLGLDIMPEDRHFSPALVGESRDDADQRALARAIRPEKSEEVAFGYRKAHAFERFYPGRVLFRQIFDLKRLHRNSIVLPKKEK